VSGCKKTSSTTADARGKQREIQRKGGKEEVEKRDER